MVARTQIPFLVRARPSSTCIRLIFLTLRTADDETVVDRPPLPSTTTIPSSCFRAPACSTNQSTRCPIDLLRSTPARLTRQCRPRPQQYQSHVCHRITLPFPWPRSLPGVLRCQDRNHCLPAAWRGLTLEIFPSRLLALNATSRPTHRPRA